MKAARFGREEAVEELLRGGADRERKDREGRDAASWARIRGSRRARSSPSVARFSRWSRPPLSRLSRESARSLPRATRPRPQRRVERTRRAGIPSSLPRGVRRRERRRRRWDCRDEGLDEAAEASDRRPRRRRAGTLAFPNVTTPVAAPRLRMRSTPSRRAPSLEAESPRSSSASRRFGFARFGPAPRPRRKASPEVSRRAASRPASRARAII